MKRLATLMLATAAGLAALPAAAHRTWLLPHTSEVEADAEPRVAIDAAVSEDLFEFDTNALPVDQVRVQRPDGSVGGAEGVVKLRRRSSFEVALPQPGLYRISSAGESAMASWEQDGEPRRWRGPAEALSTNVPAGAKGLQVTRMHNRIETFVSREGDAAAAVPAAAAGVGLELQPLGMPTGLLAGDHSRFRLLIDGKPAAQTDVTVIRGGNRYRYKLGELALKTDAQGEFEVVWPEAGRYWLGTSVGPRGPQDAGPPPAGSAAPTPPRRASYSATFEVLPP